jgi:hypothetical protein
LSGRPSPRLVARGFATEDGNIVGSGPGDHPTATVGEERYSRDVRSGKARRGNCFPRSAEILGPKNRLTRLNESFPTGKDLGRKDLRTRKRRQIGVTRLVDLKGRSGLNPTDDQDQGKDCERDAPCGD